MTTVWWVAWLYRCRMSKVPEPPRPLLANGARLWADVHRLGAVRGNIEPLLILCEQLDERVNLRLSIMTANSPDRAAPIPPSEVAAMRLGLRQLDQQLVDGFERLGLRTVMPVGEITTADDWTVKLAAVRG